MADTEMIPPIEMSMPSYYRAVDPKGESYALAVFGHVVEIDDDEETFDFIFRPSRLAGGRAVRIVNQPLALDYSVHVAGHVCTRCGRPVQVDNLNGKSEPFANFCLGVETCLQRFTESAESNLEVGDIVRVQIDGNARDLA